MELDPKLAIWLNIAYQILTAITATTLHSLNIANAGQVLVVCESLATVINIFLHAFSSPIAGPLVSKDLKK